MHLIITNSTVPDKKDNQVILSPIYGNNIFDISEYVSDSECDIIDCYVVNQIPLGMMATVFAHYIKKLRYNGKITFYGTDLYLTARKIANRDYDIKRANHALFGGPKVNEMNSSLIGVNDLCDFITDSGLKVISKQFDDVNYKVEAIREFVQN